MSGCSRSSPLDNRNGRDKRYEAQPRNWREGNTNNQHARHLAQSCASRNFVRSSRRLNEGGTGKEQIQDELQVLPRARLSCSIGKFEYETVDRTRCYRTLWDSEVGSAH